MESAIFPLAIVRKACSLAAKGYRDATRYTLPPLAVNVPAPAFVSCGSRPLSRLVYVCGMNRFQVGLSCYIADDGSFAFPG